ncbi:MAG TPA: OB-fold domain-containing protein [Bauldia sp.]|nr:OB-fold domain-containing protein [Bauldia sp.]
MNRPFWDYARQSIFALQVCGVCGHAHLPESPVCPRCLSREQSWRPSKGAGTLESWADFHRAYWDGFKDELPYRTCLVRLDEGPLIVSNLVGDPATARIGARLRVIFERISSEIALPKFTFD